MKALSIFPCFFLFLLQPVMSQKVLREFHGGGSRKDFKIHTIGDSVLLQFDETLPSGRIKRSYWITEHATTGDQIDEDVFAVARSESKTYFYYLDGRSKSRTLKALVGEGVTKKPIEASIPLNGTLLGKTTDHGLNLYLLGDDGITMTIKLVQGTNVVSERVFKLPNDLRDHLAQGIDFFTTKSSFDTFQGTANVKLYESTEVIFISIDHVDGTLILKLDLRTSEVTSNDIVFSDPNNFSSFLCDGKLFRVTNTRQKFTLNVFDVQTGSLLGSSELPDSIPDFKVYFRYGRKNIISHKATFHQMTRGSKVTTPALAVENHDGKYIVQWGTYDNQNDRAILPVPSIAGIITTIVTASISHFRERPGLLRYFYYEWDGGNAFKVRDYPPASPLDREKIDEYEIIHQTRVSEKNYIQYKDGIVAFYYDRPENYLSVVYFD
jgi:hypothetical protein